MLAVLATFQKLYKKYCKTSSKEKGVALKNSACDL